MSEMLPAALAYAEKLGWPVFPLVPGRKVPRAGSNGHLEATTDPVLIRKMWADPASNIGIRCSEFWVLDVDGIEGADWLCDREKEHGPLPRTVRQITQSHGSHVLFLNPTEGRRVVNRARFAPGCDTRSAEGYIVVAPSRAERGVYAWDVDFHPLETEISEAPEWLLALVTSPAAQSPRTAAPPDQFAALVAAGVDEGGRNATLTRLAGYFLRRYVDPYVTLEMLRLWNRDRCRPPLPDSDVVTIARSVANREAARRETRNG
ncbi:MAG: hypothetical protein DIJKHBIC_04161 [Thermoanaerobaculia bacterium]|nr:hypothetical protein [Thermoanaerobaculia bacterium]